MVSTLDSENYGSCLITKATEKWGKDGIMEKWTEKQSIAKGGEQQYHKPERLGQWPGNMCIKNQHKVSFMKAQGHKQTGQSTRKGICIEAISSDTQKKCKV